MVVMKAGEKAVSCGVNKASEIEELSFVKELHLRFFYFLFFFI
jgi:aspartate kinase